MEKELKLQINKILDNEIHNMPLKQRKKLNFMFDFKRFCVIFSLVILLILFLAVLSISMNIILKTTAMIILLILIIFVIMDIINLFKLNNDHLIKIYLNKKHSKLNSSLYDEKLVFAQQREKKWLIINDFSLQKKVSVGTLKDMSKSILFELLLDNANNKFVFYFGNDTYSDIYSYNDLVSCDVYDISATNGREKSGVTAIVSDKIFEPIALSAKDYVMPSPHKDIYKNYCDNIILKINIKQNTKKTLKIVYNFNTISISSLNYKKIKSNSMALKKVFDKIIDFHQ